MIHNAGIKGRGIRPMRKSDKANTTSLLNDLLTLFLLFMGWMPETPTRIIKTIEL